jgi:hypothetical protein
MLLLRALFLVFFPPLYRDTATTAHSIGRTTHNMKHNLTWAIISADVVVQAYISINRPNIITVYCTTNYEKYFLDCPLPRFFAHFKVLSRK